MRRPSILWIASRAVIALTLLHAFSMPVYPSDKNTAARTRTTLTNAAYRPFLINNVFNYYGNNGDGSYNKFSQSNEGFEFPKGSGKHIIFEDGLLWGGFHKGRDTAKVNGSLYQHPLQPGPLLMNGTPTTSPVAADPADPRYRTYSVRPDVRPDIPFPAVEAMLNAEEVPLISRYEPLSARAIYDRYLTDWHEWPADLGAPFTDVNMNGTYEPAVDIPGQPGADQTLWYVANDMNDSLTQRLFDCPPVGIEIRRTIWGSRRNGVFGNTIFISTVLINKSGAPVDSMFITQWSDPDLGNAGDDFVGCDTTLDLGYVYNSLVRDTEYGATVPAAGFAFIQGPRVQGAPTDTAIFLASRRPGFRNLRMSSFVPFMDGSSFYRDPYQGTSGDLEWYRVMNGTTASAGVPFLDPNTGLTTKFPCSGDPVSIDQNAGWVDGQAGMVPGDRRMAMSTGPFTLADGDTQQVIVACIASRGTDRLSSVSALRSDVRALRNAHVEFSRGRRPPPMSCSVARDTAQAAVTFRLDARDIPITSASVNLTSSTDRPVATLLLVDDGMHGDGSSGDAIWGGTVHVPLQRTGLKGGAVLTYPGGETITWENVIDHVATAPLRVASFAVASDNINSDGIANPGENVRYTFRLENDAPWDLPNLVTTASPLVANGQYTIGTLASHARFEPDYDVGLPGSYFVFDVPAGHQDSTIRVAIVTTDDSMNVWRDTLVFPVKPSPGIAYSSPAVHVTGGASGAFTIQIVDPARVKDHIYVLRGIDTARTVGRYTLKDSTTGAVLLAAHDPPDPLGHTSPVVDGFKVLPGTVTLKAGMASWAVPQGVRRFSSAGGMFGRGLEGFTNIIVQDAYDRARGTIGAAVNLLYGGIGTALNPGDCHTVLLKLAAVNSVALWDPKVIPADTNFSRAYRFLESSTRMAPNPSFVPWIINKADGFPYQDYNYSVPFSAWNMDADPPKRLAVGHMENNSSSGSVDGRYWPRNTSSDNNITREIAFIYDAPYTALPDTDFMVNLANNATTPLMWVLGCTRRTDDAWTGSDQFEIVARRVPMSRDAWVFNPSVVAGMEDDAKPVSFALLQNYPNPFNPSTTIRYELPALSEVSITVYDILGRTVRHLVNAVQPAGSHAVVWYADNDAGIRVASGVYFYRCTVQRVDRNGQFEQSMKMIVLR